MNVENDIKMMILVLAAVPLRRTHAKKRAAKKIKSDLKIVSTKNEQAVVIKTVLVVKKNVKVVLNIANDLKVIINTVEVMMIAIIKKEKIKIKNVLLLQLMVLLVTVLNANEKEND